MRRDITIKISRKNYFTITFLYASPSTVAAVTNALAAFYVDSNLRLREQDAVGTARFLERELSRMRANSRIGRRGSPLTSRNICKSFPSRASST